ncbi:MAG: PEP-CTERM sorting domain-containing protein, partial [Planctomycetes bacterium]|nr:PEP-CTERM sorting domain-containing protein [Planctomycetota bacterium]
GNVASYRVEMRLPVEFDQEVDANGTPVRVQGSGTVVARTSFTRDLPSLLPSDLTGDGAVDFDDLTILLAAWNTDVSAARGNLIDPENTLIDFQDLTRLLADWTGPADAPTDERAATAAVPEPSSLALLAMAAMSLVGWRRRRKRADRVG